MVFSGEFTLNNGKTYTFSVLGTTDPEDRSLIFSSCATDTEPAPPDTEPVVDTNVYGVTSLGIADFRRVEQEVCCYVPGEVSHIENVMAKEYKERTTRSLVSSETTTEQTEERERENLTDTTTTERNEMQSEVSQVLNEDQAQSVGGSANTSFTPNKKFSLNLNAYYDNSSSSSSSNSNSQAQTYAQEVTERAMERIVEKVQTKRTSRILKEFEENNSHGFDNRKGTEHISGVYRWVDKIYKNKLINYGKRLMYEFALPEPSKFFKQAIIKSLEAGNADSAVILPELPEHPSTLGINNPSDLDETNYQGVAGAYNAEVNTKPAENIIIGKAISSATQVSDSGEYRETLNFDEDFELPDGYKTLKAKVDAEVPQEGNLGGTVIVGTHVFGLSGYWTSDPSDFIAISSYINTIPISFSSVGFHAANIGVSIECELTLEGEQQWQNETYNAIMEAYNERLREYNEAMLSNAIIPDGSTETIRFNPLQNRAIEQRELKRIAIELLASQKGHTVSKDNYRNPNSAGVSKVDTTPGLQTHLSTVKFFEQAFDWDIMSYIFYPYFYADENDWESLFQEQDAADPLFQSFLQSGMARTIVPVRPGFEDAINWYMATGEIWEGQGVVVDTEDDLYVSVAEELQTIEGEVEGTWETRLPTNLTVIQAGSIGLNVEGLPCNEDCHDFRQFDSDGNELLNDDGRPFGNPIEQTNAVLEGNDDSASGTTEEGR